MEDKLSWAVLSSLLFGIVTAWISDPWPVFCLYGLIFGIGIVWAIWRLLRPADIRLHPLVWILSAVPAWGAAQLATSITVNRWQTMNAVMLWTANVVLFFLATQLFSDAGRRRRFLNRFLWIGLGMAVMAIFQLYTADNKIFWLFKTSYPGFIMGPFPYHNHFAAFIALILPLALKRAIQDRGRQLTYSLIAGALAAAVFASASRSGVVLVAVEVIAVLILSFQRMRDPHSARFARAALLVGIVLASGMVAGWDVVWERFHHGDAIRARLAHSSLEMIGTHPWIGTGLGTWPSAYPMHAHFDDGLFANQAHSDWLQWAAEGGVPFGLVLLFFATSLSIPAIRSIWAIGIPAVFVQASLDYPLQKPAIAAIFFVIAGAVAASSDSRGIPDTK